MTASNPPKDLFALLADFHQRGIGGMFRCGLWAGRQKQFHLCRANWSQGGLSLPDRDYYLKDSFAEKLKLYHEHVRKMFALLGEKPADAAAHAATVIELETELAKASRTRVELRDPDKNYNKFTGGGTRRAKPRRWRGMFILRTRKLAEPAYEIVGQPEFFDAVNKLVAAAAAGGLEGLSALAFAARQRALLCRRRSSRKISTFSARS